MRASERSRHRFPPFLLAVAFFWAVGATDAGETEPAPASLEGASVWTCAGTGWSVPPPAPGQPEPEPASELTSQRKSRTSRERSPGLPAVAAAPPGIPPSRFVLRLLTSRVLFGRDNARFSRPLLRAPPAA
jgi:hypothetical protein